MTEPELIAELDELRARDLTDAIRQAADDLWALLLEAHECRAWVALGYRTWEEYTATEFGMSRGHAYRLLDHGRVLREIEAVSGVSPSGDISEAATRDLKPHLEVVKDAIRQAVENVPEEDLAEIVAGVLDQERQRIIQQRDEPPLPDLDCDDDPEEAELVWTPEEEKLLAQLRTGRTVVANLHRHGNLIAWAQAEGLYERIDRTTRWGNPFVLPEDGDRHTVIANYADRYLPAKPSLLSKLSDLRGKLLGCWCAPEACHGDVLVDLVEGS
jgi:hypothetical protein